MTANAMDQSNLLNEFNALKREIQDLKSGKQEQRTPDGSQQYQQQGGGSQNIEELKQQLFKLSDSVSSLQTDVDKLGPRSDMNQQQFQTMSQQSGQLVAGRGQGRGTPPTTASSSKMNRPKPLPIEKRRQLLAEKPKTLKETFAVEPVEEIAFINWKKKRLVLIGEDRLVERALSRINSHNIHSIPVVSRSGKGVIGTIDILDIIQALISSFDNRTTNTIQQSMRRDFMNHQVSTLISKKSFVISNQASLHAAVNYMLKYEQDRFVVVNRQIEGDVCQFDHPEMDVDGIFTLSDVLKFLVSNSMLMRQEHLFNKTLKELGLGKTEPKKFHYKAIVADAFREIGRLCSMGMAIVDDDGILVGNLSATDLKGVTRNNCPILNSTVEDFLNRDQKRGWWERPFCLDLNDTLYHTVHQFVSTGIHRAYIVDRNGHPIGEVNHRDILNQLWKVLQ